MKKCIMVVLLPILSLLLVMAILSRLPAYHYASARVWMFLGNYTEAYYHLQECPDYRDTETFLEDFKLLCGTTEVFQKTGSLQYWETQTYDGHIYARTYHSPKGYSSLQESITYNEKGDPVSTYDDYSHGGAYRWDCEYDENRNLTKVTTYYMGELRSWTEYRYDQRGNRTWELCYSRGNKLVYQFENTYDDKGNLLLTVDHENGYPERLSGYEYDEKGNLICQYDYDVREPNSQTYKRVYTYDHRGNPLSETGYTKQDTETYRMEYSYDKRGNELRKTSYIGNDITYEFQYAYDWRGNQISYRHYSGRSNKTDRKDYKYDLFGNPTSVITYNDNDTTGHTEYRYDLDGNVVEEKHYGANGVLESQYLSTYDQRGNCLSRTEYTDGTLIRMIRYDHYQVVYLGKK